MKIYAILGLKAQNSLEEARKKYRQELRKRHPDVGGTAESFHELQEAWKEAEEKGLDKVFGKPIEKILTHRTLLTFGLVEKE